MSIRTKVFAAAAALTVLGGVSAVGALHASAATPSCGANCIDVFSRLLPTSHHAPDFVADVFRQGEKAGQPIILFRASNNDPAEDFTVSDQGLVSDFYAAGLVKSTLALHYGCVNGGVVVNNAEVPCSGTGVDDEAYEVQYSPYGVDSGLCAGVALTASSGEKVTLEPCGVTADTVWVVDSKNAIHGFYVPLINGSDTNFSQPYVLTYPENGYPTDTPRPQLFVSNLTGSSSAGTVQDNQMWSADFGILP